jgi:hypothetical protein
MKGVIRCGDNNHFAGRQIQTAEAVFEELNLASATTRLSFKK